MCVLATYFDSYNRGFNPFMCRGALSATDQRNVEHVEAITQTLCVDDLRNFL